MPTPTFTFKVTAADGTETGFTVSSFTGEERVSQPFEYRLTLRHADKDLDFSKVVNQAATLTMNQDALDKPPDGTDPSKPPEPAAYVPTAVKVEGIVASFRMTRLFDDGDVECEAVLVPRLWRLGMSHRSRVFQGLSVQEIVENVVGAVLEPADYAFELTETYPKREFCMQYKESHLAFVQRLLEAEGIYYFFDDGTLVFSDNRATEHPVDGRRNVTFREGTGALTPADDQVYRFVYNEQVIPQTVSLKDYDFGSFSGEEPAEEATDVAGRGGDYARVGTYAEHGRYAVDDRGWAGQKSNDPAVTNAYEVAEKSRKKQLERIAKVRAEELEAQRQIVEADSSASRIQAGHVFALDGHFRFDGDYFVTGVRHAYDGTSYWNAFTCLPAAVQFRPLRATPVPRVPGIMTAKVKGRPPADADDTSEPGDRPAYIDGEGRYRVRFPFDPDPENAKDSSGNDSIGEPSRPLRLAQPYAGSDYGIHFPNRAEAEMVFACLDGDPDRPLGLSVVPNPWTHSPVPNTGLTLGSQNPTTGSSATPGGDYTNAVTDSADSHKYTFQNTKNVIRTKVGHQLVMDDADGGANVGITLQVGNAAYESKSGSETDKYWGSKIELGGYRHLSVLERILGIASTAVGYFRNVFTRDFPGMASEALGILASQLTTDNYLDDTFGSTTPVGINIYTNKDVRVTGKDGIHITSPNIFGMFSTSLIPGDGKDTSKNQYYAEALAKFIANTVWQEVINGTADEIVESREATKKYAKNSTRYPKTAAGFKWTENFKEQRISALFFTLLQRSGVNISSMGELKMASLQSTSIAAGQGGLALKSFGNIEQKADLGIDIGSHQGIKIATKGRPYKGKGVFKVLRTLGDALTNPALKAFMGQVESRFSNAMQNPKEMFSIELHNEDGDIFLHTGSPEQKGEGDIMAHVEGKGNLHAFANEGLVHAWSGKGVVLEVGDRKGLSDDDAIQPLEDAKVGARVQVSDKSVEVHASDLIQLGTDKVGAGPLIKVVKGDQIELTCGQASIVLKKNGDITFKGNNIKIEGTKNIDLKGNKITSKAQLDNTVDGMNVKLKASLDATVQGTMTNVKGQLTAVKGSLVKMGS